MTAHSVPVLIKGQYRIVAVTIDDEDDHREQTIGYAVLNSAGMRLRQELNLDDAKAWVERCVEEDNAAPHVLHTLPKTRRTRR